MPQKTKDGPDEQDVYNMCASIGEEFKHVVYFITRYRADKVEIAAKAVPAPFLPSIPPTYVALQTFPIKTPRPHANVHFSLAFDIWCQFDGGGATAARRGVPPTWQGGIEIPRRRRAK